MRLNEITMRFEPHAVAIVTELEASASVNSSVNVFFPGTIGATRCKLRLRDALYRTMNIHTSQALLNVEDEPLADDEKDLIIALYRFKLNDWDSSSLENKGDKIRYKTPVELAHTAKTVIRMYFDDLTEEKAQKITETVYDFTDKVK